MPEGCAQPCQKKRYTVTANDRMSAAYAILIQAASSTRLCGLLSHKMFMTELGFPARRKPCGMMEATLTLNLWTGYVVGRLSLVTTLSTVPSRLSICTVLECVPRLHCHAST
jgi:hypothetical protein